MKSKHSISGIVCAPEAHCFLDTGVEVLKPVNCDRASFVVTFAEKVDGDYVQEADLLIKKALKNTSFALAIEIAAAHLIAVKALEDDRDITQWLRTGKQLATEIVARAVAKPKAKGRKS